MFDAPGKGDTSSPSLDAFHNASQKFLALKDGMSFVQGQPKGMF